MRGGFFKIAADVSIACKIFGTHVFIFGPVSDLLKAFYIMEQKNADYPAGYRASGIQFRLSSAKISIPLIRSCHVNVNHSGSHRLRKFAPLVGVMASSLPNVEKAAVQSGTAALRNLSG